jgi:hypothetical protein
MCAVQCKGDNSSGRKLLFLQSRRNNPDGVFAWWKFEKTKAENPILRLIGKNYSAANAAHFSTDSDTKIINKK